MFSSPLTRALQTALVALTGLPATSRYVRTPYPRPQADPTAVASSYFRWRARSRLHSAATLSDGSAGRPSVLVRCRSSRQQTVPASWTRRRGLHCRGWPWTRLTAYRSGELLPLCCSLSDSEVIDYIHCSSSRWEADSDPCALMTLGGHPLWTSTRPKSRKSECSSCARPCNAWSFAPLFLWATQSCSSR